MTTIAETIADTDAHNKAVEQAELTAWRDQPDRQLGYYAFPAELTRPTPRYYRANFHPLVAGATVTTWMGTVIGVITEANVYPHNFGARIVSLTMRGTNGAMYHGRASWDNGSCISLRRAK